jgi:carnitine O-acetyltransferase
LSELKKDFTDVVGAHELVVQSFQSYSKGLIKKFKCSPDQMIIQLAYFKMHGKCKPACESVQTWRSQQGRTEVCRTVSEESLAFCKALVDNYVPPEETIPSFNKALKAHVEYLTATADGRGVDRHSFGLKKLFGPDDEVPAIVKDPAYNHSSSWYISTSQLSSGYYNGYSQSQAISDGWGIAYMINENKCVTRPNDRSSGSIANDPHFSL